MLKRLLETEQIPYPGHSAFRKRLLLKSKVKSSCLLILDYSPGTYRQKLNPFSQQLCKILAIISTLKRRILILRVFQSW